MAALLNIILAPFRNIVSLLLGFFLGYVFSLTNIIPGEVVLEAVTLENIQYVFEVGADYASEASEFVMDLISDYT